MSNELDAEIDGFIAYNRMGAPRRLKQRSAEEYARDVRQFAEYLHPSPAIAVEKLRNAKVEQIWRFFQSLEIASLSAKKWSLASYYRYVQKHLRLRDDNPASEIKLEPKKKRPIIVLRREDVKELLNAPHGREAVRDRAILHFFYSGPKRKEIGQARASDFDLGKQQIIVNGRIIPLRKQAADAIAAYLRVRPESDSDALFLTSDFNKPISPRHAWQILSDCAKAMGLPQKTAFETLRKTYTVHALQDGYNVLQVLKARGQTELSAIAEEVKLVYGELGNAPNLVGEGVSDDTFDALDMERVKDSWHKVTSLLGNDLPGALRETLNLLDSVSERILKAYKVQYKKRDIPGWKHRQALAALLPDTTEENEFFETFAKNTAGIVDHIGRYRDLRSDAHTPGSERAVRRYEAEYAVNLARATVAFMVQCHRLKQEALAEAQLSAGARKGMIHFSPSQMDALEAFIKSTRGASEEDRKTVQRVLKEIAKARAEGIKKAYLTFTRDEANALYQMTLKTLPSKGYGRTAQRQVREKLARIAKAGKRSKDEVATSDLPLFATS